MRMISWVPPDIMVSSGSIVDVYKCSIVGGYRGSRCAVYGGDGRETGDAQTANSIRAQVARRRQQLLFSHHHARRADLASARLHRCAAYSYRTAGLANRPPGSLGGGVHTDPQPPVTADSDLAPRRSCARRDHSLTRSLSRVAHSAPALVSSSVLHRRPHRGLRQDCPLAGGGCELVSLAALGVL